VPKRTEFSQLCTGLQLNWGMLISKLGQKATSVRGKLLISVTCHFRTKCADELCQARLKHMFHTNVKKHLLQHQRSFAISAL
jgi:hypothetical protein